MNKILEVVSAIIFILFCIVAIGYIIYILYIDPFIFLSKQEDTKWYYYIIAFSILTTFYIGAFTIIKYIINKIS